MSADEFPTATFVLTQPIDLGATPTDGAEVTTQATGDLTLRGVTNPVTFEVTAKQDNGLIGVQGSIPVVFNDYGIANPSNGGITDRGQRPGRVRAGLPTGRLSGLSVDRNSRTRSFGRPMIALSSADQQRALHDHLVGDDHVDDLIDGGDVGVGQAELGEQRVATHEVGRRVLQLGDDRPQFGGGRRIRSVVDDLGVDPSSSAIATALLDELQFGLW